MTIDNLRIEPATMNDFDALATDSNTRGLLADRLGRQAKRLGVLLIAHGDGRTIGHVYAWDQPADEPELRDRLPGTPLIMNLWVEPTYRKNGVGTKLMTAAEQWLARRGHTKVALGVGTENAPAIRLYSGLSYNSWDYPDLKTHRVHYEDDGSQFVTWESCAIFVKSLPDRPFAGVIRLARRVRVRLCRPNRATT